MITADSIRAELVRVLESAEFKSVPRRRKLLTFLVEEWLEGRSHRLKGYTIGVAVFDRGDDFDPQTDPVVRLEARRLRRDLDSYYCSAGRNNPLRLAIPKGRYVPEVRLLRQDALSSGDKAADTFDRVVSLPAEAAAIASRRSAGRLYKWLIGGALTTVATGVILLYVLTNPGHRKADMETLTNGPALMVVPFEALSDNQYDAVLATGISDQTRIEISKFPDFRIYIPSPGAPSSSEAEARAEADRLGIHYLISGNVISDDANVRVAARLVDLRTQRILWDNAFQEKMTPGSLLRLQNEIADAIATELGQPYGVIRTELTRQLSDEFVPSMPSYECVLRAYVYRRSFAQDLHAPLLSCLEKAVSADPGYAEAWAMLGWLYLDGGRFGYMPDVEPMDAFSRAHEAASRAVLLDDSNILGLKALSSINHYLGNFDDGERFARQALALNPNDPDSLAQLGWRLAVRGKFDEGLPYVRKAIERTVNAPGWYYDVIVVDHYLSGRYAEALEAARQGRINGSAISWMLTAIAYAALGKESAAREAVVKISELAPSIARDPAAYLQRQGVSDDIVDALMAGLRKAGWS